MAKRKTDILRTNITFKEFVENISRFKSNQEKERIPPSRITEAIYNQYQKYPELLSEINKSKLGGLKRK